MSGLSARILESREFPRVEREVTEREPILGFGTFVKEIRKARDGAGTSARWEYKTEKVQA